MADDPIKLIGRVACRRLQNLLAKDSEEIGTARVVLHRLSVEEVAAIAATIRSVPELSDRIEIQLPRYKMAGASNITDEMLSDRSITELRTADCSKEARLLALFDESQEQGLAQVERINKDQLLDAENSEVWVEEALQGELAAMTDAMRGQWQAALKGLFSLDRLSLKDVAAYICETKSLWQEGEQLRRALGKSLWRLRLPSFANAFETIADQRLTHASEWKRKFGSHWANQCYLLKRNKQQAPYSKRELQESLERSKDQLLDLVKPVIERFVQADDGWTNASEELSRLNWQDVRPFFEGAGRSETQTIGQLTKEHFNLLDPDAVTQSDRHYIDGLVARGKRPIKTEEDETFYFDHHLDLQKDSALAALWDRFIFGNDVSCCDFLLGLVECVRRLLPDRAKIVGNVCLAVAAEESEKIRFKNKNEDACRYFQLCYRGLEQTLAGLVEFGKMRVFDYDSIYSELEDKKGFKPDSVAKKSLQLSFRVWIKSKDLDEKHTPSLRLTWLFNPESVLSGYTQDVGRLNEFTAKKNLPPLLRCQTAREFAVAHGTDRPLSLDDVSGFAATGRRDRGAFVPAISKAHNLGTDWRAALDNMVKKSYVQPALRDALDQQFKGFHEGYSKALLMMKQGYRGADELVAQAEAYGVLLRTIATEVQADEARCLLLRPLLEIGVAVVTGSANSDPAAVVCPWHPLRMQSIAARIRQFRSTLVTLLAAQTPVFTDGSGELFFRELNQLLECPGGPDVLIHWKGAEPVLVSLSDSLHDYSLHESPVTNDGQYHSTHENPQQTAKEIAGIVGNFLQLQPHERDNFSIVLYNCDSVPLPQAVVESIREIAEDDGQDAACQVILTHDNKTQLRKLYQRIASHQGDDDSFLVSESSRDFMSRIRINIMVEEAPEPNPKSGQPTDIVFCQDVISRHAPVEWSKANRKDVTVGLMELRPHQWSRRREMQRGDRESVVYLACPAQTEEGWSYLKALAVLCKPEFATEAWNAGSCLVPARKLNFEREETSRIVRQTHDLGTWVANFDELLDRRLLRDRNINVIRYKQSATQGRNLIISSTASDDLLRATVYNKIQGLVPTGTTRAQVDELCEKFVASANDISGQLVLRAAKRGSSTNELLGVVLSTFLVKEELGRSREMASFLLDDYATWLGQTEARVADLLILSPTVSPEGKKQLDVIITEAKFIGFDQLAGKAKDSSKQLRDSLRRIESALLATDQVPADQDIWLARLSDLLMDGLQRAGDSLVFDLSEWRSAIRRRECEVCVRGYSHVFVHSPEEYDTVGDKYTRVPQTLHGHQEQFSRSTLRLFLKAFMPGATGLDTTNIRTTQAGFSFRDRKYSAIVIPEPSAEDQPIDLPPPGSQSGGSEPEGGGHPPGNAPPSVTGVGLADIAAGADPADAAPASLAGFSAAFKTMLESESAGVPVKSDATLWLEEVAAKMRVALQKRAMTAKLLEKVLTPNAALLKFQGTDDLTVAKVEAKVSEFKTTDGLDVIAVRPELGRVAISVARPEREILYLVNVWKTWQPDWTWGNTSLLIALRENDGKPLFLSPDPQPHTLVAGITGSGKSVLMQNIVLGIAATNTMEQARIVIIDPKKGVDYFPFDGLPHLDGTIITTPEGSLERLGALVEEMHARYDKLSAAKAQNLTQFIKKTGEKVPRLWVIHDEFAVWMQDDDYCQHVTSLVNQLSVEARAAGIYLIFAAQRPDNTVFPMQLRSNLGNRLVLKVDTEGTSEVSLGIKKGGAERLLGGGHIAALVGGNPDPVFAQVPFITGDDLEALVHVIKEHQ